MRIYFAAVVLCAVLPGCAGDPFEMAEGGAMPLESASDAGAGDASTLDGLAASGDAPAAGDAASERAPPRLDGAAGDVVAAEQLDAGADQDAGHDAGELDAAAEASAPDAAPPDSAPPAPLCCVGAGQVSCSAAVECYAPGTDCIAQNVYGPDGGQYQTFSCPGAWAACSPACAAGSECLWPGPEPGQWLGGIMGACR